MNLLQGWDNFYVILGSAAAGLVGLTFVVIALLSDARRANPTGMRGYITPTIVHFIIVFALAAYMSVPNQTEASLSAGLAICGIGMLGYTAVIANNVRRFASRYAPVFEDWLWHVILPALDYAVLLAMSVLIWYRLHLALCCIAGALTLLLLIGVHNAFDVAVTVTVHKQRETGKRTQRRS